MSSTASTARRVIFVEELDEIPVAAAPGSLVTEIVTMLGVQFAIPVETANTAVENVTFELAREPSGMERD